MTIHITLVGILATIGAGVVIWFVATALSLWFALSGTPWGNWMDNRRYRKANKS